MTRFIGILYLSITAVHSTYDIAKRSFYYINIYISYRSNDRSQVRPRFILINRLINSSKLIVRKCRANSKETEEKNKTQNVRAKK